MSYFKYTPASAHVVISKIIVNRVADSDSGLDSYLSNSSMPLKFFFDPIIFSVLGMSFEIKIFEQLWKASSQDKKLC